MGMLGIVAQTEQIAGKCVPEDDELIVLREEVETLAEFLQILHREYTQLRADFAAVLDVIGGQIVVNRPETTTPPRIIVREEDPTTETITLRVVP